MTTPVPSPLSAISQAIKFRKAIDALGGTMLRMNIANLARMHRWAEDIDREIMFPPSYSMTGDTMVLPVVARQSTHMIPILVDSLLDDGTVLVKTPNGDVRLPWDLEKREPYQIIQIRLAGGPNP